jgi:hypothetical protein
MKEEKLSKIIDYIKSNETIYITSKDFKKIQSNVDKRTYLVFILITKYNLSYVEISKIFNFHRTTCYDVLARVGYMLTDKIFIDNVSEVQKLFPYTEEDVIKLHTILRNKRVHKKPEKINKLSTENVFKLTKEDVIKLKNNPMTVRVIKNIISML